jgi:hypothetical protein
MDATGLDFFQACQYTEPSPPPPMNATELLSHFSESMRGNKRFYTTAHDAPQEVKDLVMDCHDDELPNDWRYDVIVSLLFDIKNTDDLDMDTLSDIVDGQVEVYNTDLARWLADNVSRSAYVDAAREDFGGLSDDIFEQIKSGQYVCIMDMAHKLAAFLDLDV